MRAEEALIVEIVGVRWAAALVVCSGVYARGGEEAAERSGLVGVG